MFSLLSAALIRAIEDRSEFPDHLKEHADRYVRSPRAQRRDGISTSSERYRVGLW